MYFYFLCRKLGTWIEGEQSHYIMASAQVLFFFVLFSLFFYQWSRLNETSAPWVGGNCIYNKEALLPFSLFHVLITYVSTTDFPLLPPTSFHQSLNRAALWFQSQITADWCTHFSVSLLSIPTTLLSNPPSTRKLQEGKDFILFLTTSI